MLHLPHIVLPKAGPLPPITLSPTGPVKGASYPAHVTAASLRRSEGPERVVHV